MAKAAEEWNGRREQSWRWKRPEEELQLQPREESTLMERLRAVAGSAAAQCCTGAVWDSDGTKAAQGMPGITLAAQQFSSLSGFESY